MSKTVTITGWCDGTHDVRTLSVVERTVWVDSSRPVVVDLCEDHDAVVRDLLALMKNGTPVAQGKQQQATDRPLDCPLCDYVAPSRAALGGHSKGQHNMTVRELDAARRVST